MNNSKLPNFLVVGAQKSGTTSLYEYLINHPEVFLSERKEGHFFSEMKSFEGPFSHEYNSTIISSFEDYEKLFAPVKNQKAIGDISPDYLYYFRNTIKNVKKYLGDKTKIIIILRNPILRAYSSYTFYLKHGFENQPFDNAIKMENDRKKKNFRWGYYYKDIGLYYNQVLAFKKNFPNILIIDFLEFIENTESQLIKVCDFLEISSNINYLSEYKNYNSSGIPRNRSLHKFLFSNSVIKKAINNTIRTFKAEDTYMVNKFRESLYVKSKMDIEIKEYLTEFYRQDIEKLNNIVSFNTLKWIESND